MSQDRPLSHLHSLHQPHLPILLLQEATTQPLLLKMHMEKPHRTVRNPTLRPRHQHSQCTVVLGRQATINNGQYHRARRVVQAEEGEVAALSQANGKAGLR